MTKEKNIKKHFSISLYVIFCFILLAKLIVIENENNLRLGTQSKVLFGLTV